ncbi:MAG: hypothetical protein A2Y04_03660 [Omnitrophica WOR_2 bacterium GWC2_45_7]|nr:MAG: hypothetical protein A2Z81_06945 [Omnitrophica WOR_2 bacterium GWA2_45_18]OGX18323.1 MAG: hypothetical protein A2Y04_03660 [Omnitrophica WOR_2 bacterium GWC2_45_7]
MVKGSRIMVQYSDAFKRKVLQEIEDGRLTQAEARRKYGIKYYMTLRRWIKQCGKNHLLSRTVRIEMPNEVQPKETIKELKIEKQQLESALAQTQLKLIAMESLVEVAEEHFKIDIKKKFGTMLQTGPGKKLKS